MPNRTYAIEWVQHAKRNLETARLLFKEKHYTDIIAIEIHQIIEKLLKAILAYNGIKLYKTHNLMELKQETDKFITLDILTIDALIEINDYYDTERYPGPKYFSPTYEEIARNINIAENLYKIIDAYIKN